MLSPATLSSSHPDRRGVSSYHCCAACGNEVLSAYEIGEVTQDLFPGHAVRVKIGIEKKRGFRDRNVILDYMPADSSVVNLRSAR
jgi:hypothetical protein